MANQIQNVSFQSGPYGAEQAEIDRRRQYAQALSQQGMQPMGETQMAGGWAIPNSPTQGLAKMLQAYSGRKGQEAADEKQKALAERMRGDRTSDMGTLAAMLRGTPATSEQIVDEQAAGGMGAPATINAPARPGGVDPAMLGQLRSPEMQGVGMNLWAQQMARENAPPERVDLGDKIGLIKNGQIVGTLPKGATPDAQMREQGQNQRHLTPSGSTLLTHSTPSAGQLLTDERTRTEGAANRGVQVRGQNMVDTRSREQMERDKFGQPMEVTGPNGPMLAMQNKGSGVMVDANTRQPVPQIGPKVGESAQKQQTGVQTTKAAITEYRDALKKFDIVDLANPAARARMGTVYNNMLLQAKEAYNLGVLNGPDYMILQEVITNPASMTGAITSKKALDDQARKLDEIMGKVGATVSQVQSGQVTQNRRATDDPLGLRK